MRVSICCRACVDLLSGRAAPRYVPLLSLLADTGLCRPSVLP